MADAIGGVVRRMVLRRVSGQELHARGSVQMQLEDAALQIQQHHQRVTSLRQVEPGCTGFAVLAPVTMSVQTVTV